MTDTPKPSGAVLARLRGVTRRFGAVVALDGASLEIRAGEVHGVLGANGAGKTTLLSVLGGMLRPEEGTVEVGGREVGLGTPREAWRHGITLVHQHFTLVPRLTVLENLALGRRRDGGGWLPWAHARAVEALRSDAEALMERTGLGVPLDRAVEELGVGDRQRTEILKALLRDPSVLVLDEPTAVLTPSEVEGLFTLLRGVAGEGRAVVLVAHKLDEVLAVADRVTVLREGRTVLTAAVDETSARELVSAMVGEGQRTGEERLRARHGPAASAPVATLADVTVRSARGEIALDGVSVAVSRGEVVGVAGVEGNGQRELALVLAGRMRCDGGRVELPEGVGFIPQDRTTEGVVPALDLTQNVALALHDDPTLRRGPWLDWRAVEARAEALRSDYSVASPGTATRVGALSGGNQQRVVVGREVAVATDLLVAENPTRGLDVTATAFVHAELASLTARPGSGPGVVLVSTDLDEVLALSDRVYAMSRGRLLPVPEDRLTREGVGAMMLAGADG